MKADFSRISFDPAQQFSAVLHQQGRVLTDADFNEQSAIHAHMNESLAASLTGTEGAIYLEPTPFMPVELRNLPGFRIVPATEFGAGRDAVKYAKEETDADTAKDRAQQAVQGLEAFKDFNCWISPGHYYAGGLRAENAAWVPLARQPHLPADTEKFPDKPAGKEDGEMILFYLDVWERPLSWLDAPALADVALGGAVDTSIRSRIIWQVRTLAGELIPARTEDKMERDRRLQALVAAGLPITERSAVAEVMAAQPWFGKLPWLRARPRLRVRIRPSSASTDPCRPAMEAAWQGVENQLYRVEIHKPARAAKPAEGKDPAVTARPPLFKWSRENGSVAARIESAAGTQVRIFPGQLKAGGFKAGDWLEAVTSDGELTAAAGVMVRVKKVSGDLITLEPAQGAKGLPSLKKGDKLRRWDQHSCDRGAVPVTDGWMDLEGGIQVMFEPAADPPASASSSAAAAKDWSVTEFRTGDYWIFTARTALADVDWPCELKPDALIPAEVSAFFSYLPRDPGTPLPDLPLFAGPVPVRATGQPPPELLVDGKRHPAALPPHGERHRYAVLGMCVSSEGAWLPCMDARRALRLCDPRGNRLSLPQAASEGGSRSESVTVNPATDFMRAPLRETVTMKAVAAAREKAAVASSGTAAEKSKVLDNLKTRLLASSTAAAETGDSGKGAVPRKITTKPTGPK